MNIVQRMVAENLQYVTCQELANELEVSHADLWTWLQKLKKYFECFDSLQEKLSPMQVLTTCAINPFERDRECPLMYSAFAVLTTLIKADLPR